MKIAITADWHLQHGNRMADMVSSISTIVDYAVWNHLDYVLVLGDLYPTCTPSNAARAEVHRLLTRARAGGVKVIIITGNHDIANSDLLGQDHAAAEYINLKIADITVLDSPQVLALSDGTRMAFIPHLVKKHLGDKTYSDAWRMFAADLCVDSDYLFSHVLVREHSVDSSLSSERSISRHDIPAGKITVFGDIHKPDDLYVGSPDRVSFNEASDTKRFLVLDTETKVLTSIPIQCRAFQRIAFELAGDKSVVHLEGSATGDVGIDANMPVSEFIYEVLDNMGTEIENAVVYISLSGLSADIAQIDRFKLSQLVRDKHPFSLKPIHYSVSDSTTVRDVKFSQCATPLELLSEWVKKQPYAEDTSALVLRLGERIYHEEAEHASAKN